MKNPARHIPFLLVMTAVAVVASSLGIWATISVLGLALFVVWLDDTL